MPAPIISIKALMEQMRLKLPYAINRIRQFHLINHALSTSYIYFHGFFAALLVSCSGGGGGGSSSF